jgi:hypothetical protein
MTLRALSCSTYSFTSLQKFLEMYLLVNTRVIIRDRNAAERGEEKE